MNSRRAEPCQDAARGYRHETKVRGALKTILGFVLGETKSSLRRKTRKPGDPEKCSGGIRKPESHEADLITSATIFAERRFPNRRKAMCATSRSCDRIYLALGKRLSFGYDHRPRCDDLCIKASRDACRYIEATAEPTYRGNAATTLCIAVEVAAQAASLSSAFKALLKGSGRAGPL